MHPLSVQFLPFSCGLGQKSCQIIGFSPSSGVGAPTWEILDLPLVTTEMDEVIRSTETDTDEMNRKCK